MMGWIGTVALASHQVVLTCAATTFMFPLGISIAAGVRIGHAVGSQAYSALRRIAFGAVGISAAVSACFAAIYFAAGRAIAGLFTNESAVLELAALLMIVAGVFQIPDGIQVAPSRWLRCLTDFQLPLSLLFFVYWSF